MSNLTKRLERLERGRGGASGGTIYYVYLPLGMSQEEGAARLNIDLGRHDRLSVAGVPSEAPELIGQAPVYCPPGPGVLAEDLTEIAKDEAAP